jgi:hypothetical protein
MPEIGSSGLMSGDGKRGVGHRPQATAPILDSTQPDIFRVASRGVGSLWPLRFGRGRPPHNHILTHFDHHQIFPHL